MKRLLSALLALTLTCLLVACQNNAGDPVQTNLAPLAYQDLASLAAARHKSPGDLEKSQKLTELEKIYGLADVPNNLAFKGFTVTESYVTAHYTVQTGDEDFLKTLANTPLTKEELQAVAITYFRNLGQSALQSYLADNPETITNLEADQNAVTGTLAYAPGYYQKVLIARNYDFLVENDYISVSLPGSLSESEAMALLGQLNSVELNSIG